MGNRNSNHASEDLRGVFEKIAELISSGEDLTLDTEIQESDLTVRNIIGQLWNCTDVVPSDVFDSLVSCNVFGATPENRSYAVAVRALKKYLED